MAVKKLRLSSRVKKGDRISLEADASGNSKAVYDLLAQISKTLPLSLHKVTLVELAATVSVNPKKPPKRVTIRITYPNSCSLKWLPEAYSQGWERCFAPKNIDTPAYGSTMKPYHVE